MSSRRRHGEVCNNCVTKHGSLGQPPPSHHKNTAKFRTATWNLEWLNSDTFQILYTFTTIIVTVTTIADRSSQSANVRTQQIWFDDVQTNSRASRSDLSAVFSLYVPVVSVLDSCFWIWMCFCFLVATPDLHFDVTLSFILNIMHCWISNYQYVMEPKMSFTL